ncbi:MAG: hypothetical protein ACHQET_12990 [Chitinophagales bacterium]
MLRLLYVLSIIAFLMTGCNQNKASVEEKADSTAAKKMDSVSYPYKAGYSSSFEIGKPESSKIVLDIWKAFEDNKLDDTKALWADSVTLQFENFTFHGSPDSTIAGGKRDRAQYSSLIDSVDAWMPIHSTDRNEDWVAVWGREYSINKKGKKDTSDIHEIWMLRNGKVAYMSQYRAHRKR